MIHCVVCSSSFGKIPEVFTVDINIKNRNREEAYTDRAPEGRSTLRNNAPPLAKRGDIGGTLLILYRCEPPVGALRRTTSQL